MTPDRSLVATYPSGEGGLDREVKVAGFHLALPGCGGRGDRGTAGEPGRHFPHLFRRGWPVPSGVLRRQVGLNKENRGRGGWGGAMVACLLLRALYDK